MGDILVLIFSVPTVLTKDMSIKLFQTHCQVLPVAKKWLRTSQVQESIYQHIQEDALKKSSTTEKSACLEKQYF